MTTAKHTRIFCNDPNKRLKNLFTIVRPDEKLNENEKLSKCFGIDLLNKTKDLLVKLIDNELKRVQPDIKLHRDIGVDKHRIKMLKLECIRKIEEELRLMKRLED